MQVDQEAGSQIRTEPPTAVPWLCIPLLIPQPDRERYQFLSVSGMNLTIFYLYGLFPGMRLT